MLTVQIRLMFKNFDDFGFRFGLRLLNYKGRGSVWIQRKKAVNTGFRFTFRFDALAVLKTLYVITCITAITITK